MNTQELELRENFQNLKTEAYAGLMQKRNSKVWIFALETAPRLLGQDQGELLLAVNTGMRLLDDIADGDRTPPLGESREARIRYLLEKQAFIRNPERALDELDHLFAYCYQKADRLGIEIHEELDAFFDYFLFDARRLGTGKIFTQTELDQAYDACDIRGTISGSLKVFGDDAQKTPLLLPLGRAVRKYYTLRDYEQDIAAGFVNIPAESMLEHGVRVDDLANPQSPSVREWFKAEAVAGLELLRQHKSIVGTGNFRLKGRATLPFLYERPARNHFEAVLAGKK